jgi:hypothetical protein
MAIESFNTRQKLMIITTTDQNLVVVFDRLLQNRKRTGVELEFFLLTKLFFCHFRSGFIGDGAVAEVIKLKARN